jgi:hypothetical protein
MRNNDTETEKTLNQKSFAGHIKMQIISCDLVFSASCYRTPHIIDSGIPVKIVKHNSRFG